MVIGVEPDVIEVVVFAAGADAFLGVGGAVGGIAGWTSVAWPRKMGTNWFMPALVKSRFGESGMSDDDGTMVCCFSRKKSRNDWRISADVIAMSLARIERFSRGAGDSARVAPPKRESRAWDARYFFSSSSFGIDNVLFSVDWPYESNSAAVDFLKRQGLDPRDLEKVAHTNAERVLRL